MVVVNEGGASEEAAPSSPWRSDKDEKQEWRARRDAELMGQVYSFLGLTVGLVQQGTPTAQRRPAYACGRPGRV